MKIDKHSENRIVARWETKGNDFLVLVCWGASTHPNNDGKMNYHYSGNGCGGGFAALDDDEAVSRMEAPWGDIRGTGQVTVLKSDRSSLRRVK